MTKIKLIVFAIVGTIGFFAQSVRAQSLADYEMTYPVAKSDKDCVVNAFNTFYGLSDDKIFANALLWTIENISPSLREDIEDISIAKKSFVFPLTLADEEKSKNTFACKAKVQVGDGRMVVLLTNITVKSPVLVVSKVTPFEKLQPEKKESHKAIINEFERLETSVIKSIVAFIDTNPLSAITHWNEIAAGKVVNGMSQDECMLAFGKPLSASESGGETQWMYSASFYIFFKNGVVSSFIR